jgi:hypothetical protein
MFFELFYFSCYPKLASELGKKFPFIKEAESKKRAEINEIGEQKCKTAAVALPNLVLGCFL